MSIWVCRTGSKGQYEKIFFDNSCICLTREGYDFDLTKTEKTDLVNHISKICPDAARQTITNTWSQIDIFANKMKVGDLVIIPRKNTSFVSVARIEGEYSYDKHGVFPLNHFRRISVIATDVNVSSFPQDIRYSLGAFRTVFGVRQENRLVEELRKAGVTADEI